MSGPIRPKIELDRAFMPVLVTSNFDDDSIKMNKVAWRHHFPILSLQKIFKILKDSLLHSQWSHLVEIQTCPRFYACPRYLQV